MRERDVAVPLAELEDFFTAEDRAHLLCVMDLEAAGDLAGALRLLRAGIRASSTGST